jgi:hypothetical protein
MKVWQANNNLKKHFTTSLREDYYFSNLQNPAPPRIKGQQTRIRGSRYMYYDEN